jgi:PKD repeat protein/6-phosphogluconolactonase (cycloisomerase 2 family)
MGIRAMFAAAVALLALAGNAQALDLVIARGATDGLAVSHLAADDTPGAFITQDDANDVSAWSVVFSADATRVYVSTYTTIRVYERDVSTGTLTFASEVPLAGSQMQPENIALTPSGRFLYASTYGGGSNGGISGYAVGFDGSLTPIPGATVMPGTAGVTTATDAVVTPDGTTLLVGHDINDGTAGTYAYAINASTGALTARTPAFVASSDGVAIGVSTDGAYAFTAWENLRVYELTANGLGALVSTAALPANLRSRAMSTDPRGGGLAVAVASGVQTFSLSASGVPTARATSVRLPGSTIPAGALTFAPSGDVVYAGSAHTYEAVGFAAFANGTSSLSALPLGFSPPTSDKYRGLVVSPAQAPVAVLLEPVLSTGRLVAFDASSSTSDSTTIARYDWDFGDGTTLADGGAQPTHTYAAAGSYTARVTVTNGFGCSTSAGIWTGTQYSCVGGASATTTRSVTVSDASTAPAGSTPAATTSTPTLRTTTPTTTVRANAVDVATTVTATGPGVITVRGTLPGGRATKAACTSKRKVTKSGSYGMTCRLGKAARAMLRTRPLRVTLLTAFTPTGGSAVTTSRVVVVPRRK